MKKNRVFGKAATAVTAIALIGASGAAYALANEYILADEIGRIAETAAYVNPPPVIAEQDSAAATADINTEAETDMTYTVTDAYALAGGTAGTYELPETALTAREAADTAAEYYLRVFGYSSGGKEFAMYSEQKAFNFSFSGQYMDDISDMYSPVERAVWNGYLLEESDGTLRTLAIFSMDAITGEMISAKLTDITIPDEPVAMRSYLSRESVDAWNGNREEFLELAKNFGEKHFRHKAVSAEFESTTAVGVQIHDGDLTTTVNEAGEKVPEVTHHLYEISVKDGNGEELIVAVTDNTRELYEIYNAAVMLPENRKQNAEVRAEMGYK